MNHKISIGVTISIAAVVCALTFIITWFVSLQSFNAKVQAVKEKAEKYERLETLDTYVRTNFYQAELDEEGVMNGILKGYVSGLGDPYSKYLTAEEYDAQLVKEAGQSVGIGVTVQREEDDSPRIIEVNEGSPAEEAGLQVNDILIAVGDLTLEEDGYDALIDAVRGEEGTTVTLTVRRGEMEVDYSIKRRTFDVKTVSYQMLDGQIGYVRVTNFRENTVDQFSEALDTLTAQGAQALIFDMRSNGGGLLDSLEKMVDPLLPEGVIATATYQDGRTENVVLSDADELDLPMAVLVNGSTASAAELFAASLRDFAKAELVGTTTYGKGVMQTTRHMEDGGAVTLTVATYQTSRSECYQGIGLTPDIEVEADEDTIISAADPETDPQLSAAIAAVEEDVHGDN